MSVLAIPLSCTKDTRSCWSQGKIKDEALVKIREDIELFLEPENDEFSTNADQEICELVL